MKRWISSTKRMVRSPIIRLRSAAAITSLISLMPLVTALKSTNSAWVRRAMMRARVVLPTPGGPQKIMEEIKSWSMSWRRIFPSPNRWRWPANSSSVSGRRRAARGCDWVRESKKLCCFKRFSLLCAVWANFCFLHYTRRGGRGQGRARDENGHFL